LPEAQLDRFMFSLWLDYPLFDDELTIVKNTTSQYKAQLNKILTQQEIIDFQQIIRKIPINDNVLKYAVTLASKTRPESELAPEITKNYLKWGAGPRASQYLVVGAKTHAALHGKYSPDIEDVKAVAVSILRHRIIKNYKAEAENISIENIIDQLL
jgi:MoxR-like ATPase